MGSNMSLFHEEEKIEKAPGKPPRMAIAVPPGEPYIFSRGSL